MGKSKNTSALKAGIIACAATTSVSAQDTGGLSITLDVGQSLQYSDNVSLTTSPESGFQAVTDILLSGSSETRSQALSFSVGSTGTFDTGESSTNGFTNPALKFSYSREAKSSSLTAYGSYLLTEVSSIVGDDDPNLSFVVLSTGDRQDLRYGAELEMGRDAPVTTKFTFAVSDRDYIDTIDPTLVDNRTTNVGADVSLQFDRRITGTIGASLNRYEEPDRTRDTLELSLGADLAVSQSLTVGASINYDQIDTDDGGAMSQSDGFGYQLTATQTLKNGNLTGFFASDFDSSGRRTTARVGRTMALRSGGMLDFSLGLTSEDGNTNPLYALTFGQELPRGAQIGANITQSIQTDFDGNDSLNSSLAASYTRPLTDVSSFKASLQYKVTDGLDVAGEDASLVDFDLTYRHEFVQNWDVTAGYNYSLATADLQQDRSSNTLSVGIEKSFDWK